LAKCPYCGFEVPRFFKEWLVKPRRGGSFKTKMYACPNCGRRFREAEKI